MKKIMFLIYSLAGGGAERVLIDTVNNLDKEKYHITLCTLFHDPSGAERLNKEIEYKPAFRTENKRLKKIISGIIQYLVPSSWVYQCFFKGDYDVEIAFMEAFPTKILAYANSEKSRKYTWVHIDMKTYTKQDRLYRSLAHQKKCYETFDGIYCVSEMVRTAFIQKFGIREKVHVAYNILNEKEILRRAEGLDVDFLKDAKIKREFKMVSAGSLIPRKGFDRLIRICGRLYREGLKIRLQILGEGPLKTELEDLIEKEGLNGIVTLSGFQENPYPIIKNADLYVCSSYVEGFSTVVSEAVILHVPVVTTNSSGMEEILGKSEYGIVTENREEALYRQVYRMITDATFYRHYQEKVKERSTFFSMEERLRDYERILDQ